VNEVDFSTRKTIDDFGDQWTRYVENNGYYASTELLADIVTPFFSPDDFRGLNCAEIGAGTRRISTMMLEAGAAHITAVEPSRAFAVLKRNLERFGDRVTCVQLRGDQLASQELDLVVSIGVLHHIPDPDPVVQAALRSLKEGGKVIVWLYGSEGNFLYRIFVEPIRIMTRRLPVRVNEFIAHGLYSILSVYGTIARRFQRIPLARYLNDVYFKFDKPTRVLVIVDQLNPQWAKYYDRESALKLLQKNGFADVRIHHRHGYSWTVTGVKRTVGLQSTVEHQD
jgi:SAM-dependent methyltransferase